MQPSYRYIYILVVATYNITYTLLKINLPFIKCRSTIRRIYYLWFNLRVDISGARMHGIFCASVVASRLVIHLRTCCVFLFKILQDYGIEKSQRLRHWESSRAKGKYMQ